METSWGKQDIINGSLDEDYAGVKRWRFTHGDGVTYLTLYELEQELRKVEKEIQDVRKKANKKNCNYCGDTGKDMSNADNFPPNCTMCDINALKTN